MGAGASSGICEALQTKVQDDITALLAELSPAHREKLEKALNQALDKSRGGGRGAQFPGLSAQCIVGQSNSEEESSLAALSLRYATVTIRNIAGDTLAEMSLSCSFTVEQLAQEMQSRIPLIDPLTRYVFLHGDNKLTPDALLSSCSAEFIELTMVKERLPWCLSSESSAKSTNVQIIGEDGTSAMAHTNGGVVMSAYPVPWKEGPRDGIDTGAFTYEVVIDGIGKRGLDEGVELGVTTSIPSSVDLSKLKYAVLHKASWISSDAGTLWINGSGDFYSSKGKDNEHWKTTCPSALHVGDVVRFSVKANGGIQVSVNDAVQAVWDDAAVAVQQPLYAIVGMRLPCNAITVRLPDV